MSFDWLHLVLLTGTIAFLVSSLVAVHEVLERNQEIEKLQKYNAKLWVHLQNEVLEHENNKTP